MNNVTLGGIDPRNGRRFAYYETIGGGMGGRNGLRGISGVHTHMSNTRNTPIEAIEHYLPVRIRQYRLRQGSGGAGQYRGGEGIVREYQMLTDTAVTVLSDRRTSRPTAPAAAAREPSVATPSSVASSEAGDRREGAPRRCRPAIGYASSRRAAADSAARSE